MYLDELLMAERPTVRQVVDPVFLPIVEGTKEKGASEGIDHNVNRIPIADGEGLKREGDDMVSRPWGEINLGASVGVNGVSVVKDKSGVTIRFHSIYSPDGSAVISLNETDNQVEITKPMFQAFHDGGTTLEGTEISIEFSAEAADPKTSGYFEHSHTADASEVTIKADGKYKVYAKVNWESEGTSGGARGGLQIHLQKWTGSSWDDVPRAKGGLMVREQSDAFWIMGCDFTILEDCDEDDKLRVRAVVKQPSGPDGVTGPCVIIIERVGDKTS